MKKIEYKNGTNGFAINLDIYVNANSFGYALANFYYRSGQLFNGQLKKREAMNILKGELFNHGRLGEQWGEDNDQTEELNEIHIDAIDWVLKNYPFLSND